MDEDDFHKKFDERFNKGHSVFSKTLNILVVGKVSAGKSSLINALFERDRTNPIADVGAESGVTTETRVFPLNEHTTIIDSPGLHDINASSSDKTKEAMKDVDAGILVVTGSADATQKDILDELKKTCSRTFVVINKFDEHDRNKQSSRDRVLSQWRTQLGEDTVFPTCTFGFDPDSSDSAPMDIRGVDELREAIFDFLREEGKDLLLARNMKDKSRHATRIIATSAVAVAGEAFIPGSAALITATQAVAICSLYYLYTGRVMSKQSALAALPAFAAQAVGSNLFLFAKSLLPPTGVIDAAAATVAVGVTTAMLITVNIMFSEGHELNEKDRLRTTYSTVKGKVERSVKGASVSDFASMEYWRNLIREIMYA